jgi:hypothetical protein
MDNNQHLLLHYFHYLIIFGYALGLGQPIVEMDFFTLFCIALMDLFRHKWTDVTKYICSSIINICYKLNTETFCKKLK